MYYTTPDRTRHFLIPEDADLPPGDLELRTPTGERRSAEPAAAAPYEVTKEEAKAWAKEQLGEVFGEMRGKVLDFTERLKARTAAMREENRATLDEAAGGASPEVREALDHLRSGLRDLGRAIQRVARENRERAEAEDAARSGRAGAGGPGRAGGAADHAPGESPADESEDETPESDTPPHDSAGPADAAPGDDTRRDSGTP